MSAVSFFNVVFINFTFIYFYMKLFCMLSFHALPFRTLSFCMLSFSMLPLRSLFHHVTNRKYNRSLPVAFQSFEDHCKFHLPNAIRNFKLIIALIFNVFSVTSNSSAYPG